MTEDRARLLLNLLVAALAVWCLVLLGAYLDPDTIAGLAIVFVVVWIVGVWLDRRRNL